MCGLVGVYYFDPKAPVDSEVLRRQTETLRHRGPDGGAYWAESGIGLGHRRLSIIDIGGGQQPMFDRSGRFALVFNGEIYNYRELRETLRAKGHDFLTDSDSEVLLLSYLEWGQSCVDHFNGMYAFAIYDRKQHSLFLGRDRLGKKPLYIYRGNDRIIFASELKAIVAADEVDRSIDYRAVADFFALAYIPSPKTIFCKVEKLPAGHVVLAQRGALGAPRQYWDVDFGEPDHGRSAEEHAENLRELLEDSVRLRMRSDVPVGAFLSGGIDSSLVACAMQRQSATPVFTQAVGFHDNAFDERAYAREVASLCGTSHSEQLLEPEASAVLPSISYFYDEPFGDSSAAPSLYLCKATREQVTVALSGDGGDEPFAGYDHYDYALWTDSIRARVPRLLRSAAALPLRHLFHVTRYSRKLIELNQQALFSSSSDRDRNAYHHLLPQPYRYRELLSTELKRELGDYDPFDNLRDIYRRSRSDDLVSRMQYCDIKSYLCDDILVKVDRASMANSLEVRCPLLDHRIVEYATRIPRNMNLAAGGKGKKILREVIRPWLDPALFDRPKQGFAVPLASWLSGPLQQEMRARILNGGKSGYLAPLSARRMVEEQVRGLAHHEHSLWNATVFESWIGRALQGEDDGDWLNANYPRMASAEAADRLQRPSLPR